MIDPFDQEIGRSIWHRVSPGVANYDVLVVDGNPPRKERPRTNTKTGQVYHSPEGKAAEEATAQALRLAFRRPLDGNVAIAAVFVRKDRSTADGDNLLKHLLDSANGILWHDDAQVTAMLAVIEVDRDRPRTVLAVGRHVSTMDRSNITAARSKTRTGPRTASSTFNQCTSCGRPISRGSGDLCKTCRP